MSHRSLPFYLSVLVGIIVLFHIVGFIKAERSPIAIGSHASIPRYALQNARIYLDDGNYYRSALYLSEAVRSMEYLRDNSSGTSLKHLTTGLEALQQVEDYMAEDYFYSDKLNESSVIALNALIYYEIESARTFIMEDKVTEGIKALEIAVEHLRSALGFSKGNKKEYEIAVFSDIHEVISNYSGDRSQMIAILDGILDELKDLEISYTQ
ncbi:hypothetical protein [Ekhidna sp.]|uniref:hypothetical protein n=1 Tax=Ekhidna sp. TaxID=2608089 RepID=UPI003518BD79